jgi:plasmid stabilization system protein ParE
VKKYHVLLTDKAEADVADVLAWFRDQSAHAAGAKWFAQLMAVVDKLETLPERCAKAAEGADLGLDLREILVGKRRGVYRVIFEIEGRTVHILRVWHSARDALSADDV